MLNLDYAAVKRDLLLTQKYCAEQLLHVGRPPSRVLRTINPELNGTPAFSFAPTKANIGYGIDYDEPQWSRDPYADGSEMLFADLFETQMRQKVERCFGLPEVKDAGTTGRIVALAIYGTVWDGASEFETRGFIDVYDCPPIDTWFCLTDTPQKGNRGKLLLSWIPTQFVRDVSLAIDVNPVGCIEWFGKWYPAEHRHLTD